MDFKPWQFIPTILFILGLLTFQGDGIIEVLVVPFLIFFILTAFGTTIASFIIDIKTYKYFLILHIIELIIFIIILRPWFQPLVMFFYLRPAILEIFLIALLISVIVGLYLRQIKQKYYQFIAAGAFLFMLILLGIIFAAFTSAYTESHLARHLDITEITELPEMDTSFMRITPMKVADRYATDATQYPRHTPSKPPDIVQINDKPHWAYVLAPDGLVNYYDIKPIGALFVDMTTTRKELDITEQTLTYAQDIGIEDDIYWQLHLKKFFIDAERTLVLLYNDDLYLAVPYIEFDMHFEFPIWYQVPRWGGIFLVDKDGNIEDLTPEEAREHDILKDQKLFPEKLVITYVDSQKYWKAQNGSYIDALFNVWFHHEDEIEITDISNQGNQQPFLMNTLEGLKWIVSVEPYGEANAIFRIYLIDARTGEIEMKRYNGEEIGPVKAGDYTRKNHPEVDWSQFQTIEPIPVAPNGDLYWEVRVTPYDGSGISYIAFVDPLSGDVVEARTDAEVLTFIEGLAPPASNTTNLTITGPLQDIDSYIQNGNTRWILDINGTILLARAEDFNETTIKILLDLQLNENIIVNYSDSNIITKIEII
jgi:hypothetical protein